MEPTIDSYMIPIVIGVCGHRHLTTAKEELRERLAEIWDHLRRHFPHTPFLVLDSLAEGAERVVLEYLPKDVRYVAVLPFAAEEYEKTFTSPESRAAFAEYRRKAAGEIVAGDSPGDRAAAAKFVRKHADFLLALWDEAADPITADVLRKPEEKAGLMDAFLNPRELPDEQKRMDIIKLPVVCADRPAVAPAVFPVWEFIDGDFRRLLPENWRPDWIVKKIDQINAELPGFPSECISEARREFCADQTIRQVESAIARYAFFDRLSLRSQKKQKSWFHALFFGALFAGLAILPWSWPVRPDTQLLVVLASFFLLLNYFQGCFDSYLDNRRLAEALRIRIYWRLFGIDRSVADFFSGNDLLIRSILRNCELEEMFDGLPGLHEEQTVRERWLEEQHNWYKRKAKQHRGKDRQVKLFEWATASVVVLIGLILYHAVGWKDWMSICVQGVLFLFFCGQFWQKTEAWSEIADAFDAASLNFGFGADNIEKFSPAERREVVLKLGERALRENSTWRNVRKRAQRT